MKRSEQSLYPKISSIYNKILQLAIAVVLIIVVMNLWLAVSVRSQETIERHFDDVGELYLQQIAVAVQTLLKQEKPAILLDYIEQLGQSPMIKDVSLYDPNGKLLARSTDGETVKELFGLAPSFTNRSQVFVPFVQELRSDVLLGYLRLSVKESYLTSTLRTTNDDGQQLLRLMLIMAGLAGFLLTRGFSRFSRQGYRLEKNGNS